MEKVMLRYVMLHYVLEDIFYGVAFPQNQKVTVKGNSILFSDIRLSLFLSFSLSLPSDLFTLPCHLFLDAVSLL